MTLDQLVATDKWLEMDAHGARNHHSDKEKFPGDLNRPESYEISERLLKTLRKSGDFQAEYEGSIPFTRSNPFRKIPIQEPIGDKMRRILKSYVEEAKTDDERERAERELQKLETASGGG